MNTLAAYGHILESPVGRLLILVDSKGVLLKIQFERTGHPLMIPDGTAANKYACGSIALQLEEYFAKKRIHFDCPLAPQGSPFQQLVWETLARTLYGETLFYSELAALCGKPRAIRAVAGAVASNPIPIVIPCHRILPKSGGIGNFASHSLDHKSGTRIKGQLLALEGYSGTILD